MGSRQRSRSSRRADDRARRASLRQRSPKRMLNRTAEEHPEGALRTGEKPSQPLTASPRRDRVKRALAPFGARPLRDGTRAVLLVSTNRWKSGRFHLASRRDVRRSGRSSALRGSAALTGADPPLPVRDERGMTRSRRSYRSGLARKHPDLQVLTGATGLEPATSGVTGRYGAAGCDRLRAGITGYSRVCVLREQAVTGYDRLPPGTACVAYVWSA